MLTQSLPHKQRGMILLMTLVVLVAMTLAAVALMRSSDTTSLIAGNLAFRQSVIQSADVGIEAAVNWLETNNNISTLSNSNTASGYAAANQDPASNQSWDDFWTSVLATQAVALATDSAGNTVAYAIQRLCNGTGVPGSIDANGRVVSCQLPPPTAPSQAGTSLQVGGASFTSTTTIVYYRITVRVDGPRGTLSYVQSIAAM